MNINSLFVLFFYIDSMDKMEEQIMENRSNIAEVIGQRLRARRVQLGYSQDLTSEKADLHPTYIGQVERGEKNVTICSLEKICIALDLPMEELFANIVEATSRNRPAQQCYDLIVSQPVRDQKKLYTIIENIVKYKNE